MTHPFESMTLAELGHSRAVLQDYILRAVTQARRDGSTWDDIGRQLGVSRAEAHRRYSWVEKIDRHNSQQDDG